MSQKKKFGLILRSYVCKQKDGSDPTMEVVMEQITAMRKVVDAAKSLIIDGAPLFDRIDVLVFADKKYHCDYGDSAEYLQHEFKNEKDVHISKVENGDIFCGLLNYGVALQTSQGIDCSFIASKEAVAYMTPKTVGKMTQAIEDGALVSGAAINELADSVMAGRIVNTLACWDNTALMTVGGFDLKAAMPKRDDKHTLYVQGWSEEKGDVYYPLAGVEEIIPLIRLTSEFGKCIAPIMTDTHGSYVVPDPHTDPARWEHHIKKMGTKLERQGALAYGLGYELSFIEGGIMPEYRKISQSKSDVKPKNNSEPAVN